jgi:hypothetical protein
MRLLYSLLVALAALAIYLPAALGTLRGHHHRRSRRYRKTAQSFAVQKNECVYVRCPLGRPNCGRKGDGMIEKTIPANPAATTWIERCCPKYICVDIETNKISGEKLKSQKGTATFKDFYINDKDNKFNFNTTKNGMELTIFHHKYKFGDRDKGYHSVNDESSVLYFEKDMKTGRKNNNVQTGDLVEEYKHENGEAQIIEGKYNSERIKPMVNKDGINVAKME